jgi:hypothetical protein
MSSAITTPATPTQTPPANGSYVERLLQVTITLGEGTFGQTGMNTVTFGTAPANSGQLGLRIAASVQKGGYPSMDTAEIRIYGLTPTIMNQVATLSVPQTMQRQNNTVTLSAGDAVNGMSQVYSGNIVTAWKDFDGMPETFFQIIGTGGLVDALKPVPPISYPGGADVATIMAGIANQMGLAFENSGVQVQISNPYFSGTLTDQMHAVARQANIEAYIDRGANPAVLAIWPKTSTRNGLIPLIAPTSGLVLYPKYRDFYLSFRCIFNPNIRIGGQIQIQSSAGGPLAPANGATLQQTLDAGPNGTWYVKSPLTLDLASQIVDGPWFCDVQCARTAGNP